MEQMYWPIAKANRGVLLEEGCVPLDVRWGKPSAKIFKFTWTTWMTQGPRTQSKKGFPKGMLEFGVTYLP